jgi:hypothetical protein
MNRLLKSKSDGLLNMITEETLYYSINILMEIKYYRDSNY